MAGKQTRPRVDQQFRAEAIRLVEEHPERTKSSIARELGVDPKTLYAWLNAEKQRSESTRADASNVSAELARVQRELKVVTQERDILKNAVGTSLNGRDEIRLYRATPLEVAGTRDV